MTLALVVLLGTVVTSTKDDGVTGGFMRPDAPDPVLWDAARSDMGVPMEDMDGDFQADIEESIGCGRHDYWIDNDRDGMADLWENMWVNNNETGPERLLYNNDQMDAYEDPDHDGYDFDRDGTIEGTDDRVTWWRQAMPPTQGYEPVPVKDVLRMTTSHVNEQVLVSGAAIKTVNVSTGQGRDLYGTAISLWVAEFPDEPREDWLEVRTDARSHRPLGLVPSDEGFSYKRPTAGSVDIQGVVRFEDGRPFVEVRGTEEFTNLLEFQFRYLVGNPFRTSIVLWYNQTNPFLPDTDGDSMSDGWEAFYGSWRYERYSSVLYRYSDERFVVWEGGPNPTWGGDVKLDADHDGLTNLDEFALGTAPISDDTDGDLMPDGWEVRTGLDPTRRLDALLDPDGDGASSLEEFLDGTDPRWADARP